MVLAQVQSVSRRLVEQDAGVLEPTAQDDHLLRRLPVPGAAASTATCRTSQLRGELAGLEQLGQQTFASRPSCALAPSRQQRSGARAGPAAP